MADILVTSPFQPFTLPTQFKAVFNGYVYCGTVDAVDPSVSQVQVYLINESGDKVPVAQPLRTNAGGYLVYNGQPAKFVTDSNHSLLVQDQQQGQIWYAPNMAEIDPDSLYQLFIETRDTTLFITTVGEVASGKFLDGDFVKITDRNSAIFEISNGGVANGFDVITAGTGKTATLVIYDKTVNCIELGLTPSADNQAALAALNNLITAGRVRKVLMTEVYNTSDEYTVPVVAANLSYVGLHGGLKPTLSGLNFTHSVPTKNGWNIPGRASSVHLEALCSVGNSAGQDGFNFSGIETANYTAESLYSKNWGRDGFYINNLFISRMSNLMSEDSGRDGIHFFESNEIQIPGFSVERAGRWGVFNEIGYINTGTGNCSDCGTNATGGGLYMAKGAACNYTLYYEAPASGRSHTAFVVGGTAVDTTIKAYVSKFDTWQDDGIASKIDTTGRGVFNADPRGLGLNIINPCFELSAHGTGNWISNEGSVSLTRVNDGHTGPYSLQAAITGTSGNANFYMFGEGYSMDVVAGQTLYVSFSIKTSRDIGTNGVAGEFLLAELIGLSDTHPDNNNTLPVTRAGVWRKMTMAFYANVSASDVSLRLKMVELTANVNVQITDIVFTTSIAPVKIAIRPDSTAIDVATLKNDFNLLLEQFRNNGLIART